MTETQVTWLTQESHDRLKKRARLKMQQASAPSANAAVPLSNYFCAAAGTFASMLPTVDVLAARAASRKS